MRTTVIPAQITTVEDKIAGSLNLTQIILLLMSLFIAVFIYAVLPQRLAFSLYKLPLIAVSLLTCCFLALRVKNRVILNWILLLAGYYLRPRYYVFNKNDSFLREIDIIPEPVKKKAVKHKKAKAKTDSKVTVLPDFAGLEKLLATHRDDINIRFNKKGGMDAIWQTK